MPVGSNDLIADAQILACSHKIPKIDDSTLITPKAHPLAMSTPDGMNNLSKNDKYEIDRDR
jgi:hypothetical protein